MAESEYKKRLRDEASRRMKARVLVGRSPLLWIFGLSVVYWVMTQTPNLDAVWEIKIPVIVFVVFNALLYLDDRYSKIPEEIYDSQQRRIDAFWAEELDLDISRDPVYTLPDRDNQDFLVTTLSVKNGTQKRRIIELEAILEDVDVHYIDEEGDWKHHPFFGAEHNYKWSNGEIQTELRSKKADQIQVAGLPLKKNARITFGAQGFSPALFGKEGVFILSIRFTGRYLGEDDERHSYQLKALYCDPSQHELLWGDPRRLKHKDIHDQLKKVIEVAERGYAIYPD